jgi:hypothetical protein
MFEINRRLFKVIDVRSSPYKGVFFHAFTGLVIAKRSPAKHTGQGSFFGIVTFAIVLASLLRDQATVI